MLLERGMLAHNTLKVLDVIYSLDASSFRWIWSVPIECASFQIGLRVKRGSLWELMKIAPIIPSISYALTLGNGHATNSL